MCVHASVHTEVHMCGGQRYVWVSPSVSLLLCEMGLSLNLEFARLSGQETPGILPSPLPAVGNRSLHHTARPFNLDTRDQTSGLK